MPTFIIGRFDHTDEQLPRNKNQAPADLKIEYEHELFRAKNNNNKIKGYKYQPTPTDLKERSKIDSPPRKHRIHDTNLRSNSYLHTELCSPQAF